MAKALSAGFGYFREGFRLIRQPGVRGYVIVPVLINILVFALIAYLSGSFYGHWVDQAVDWLPEWLDFIAWLLWLVFALLFLLILAYGFVFLTNLIGAPFYGLLAEKVEERLTGEVPDAPLTFRSALLMVPRSLWREVQKLLYYLPRVLGIFILGFIPVVQAGAPVLSALFAAWMMAVQFVDFSADNQGTPFPRMRHQLARRRVMSGTFGGCVLVATLIPVVNLFAMPAAVAGGTALWVRELRSFGARG